MLDLISDSHHTYIEIDKCVDVRSLQFQDSPVFPHLQSVLPECYQCVTAGTANWFILGSAVCCHVYAIMTLKDP